MQSFIIPVSKTKSTWLFYASLGLLAIVAYRFFENDVQTTLAVTIYIAVMIIFCLIAVFAYRDMKHTPPLYIINEEGIYSGQHKRVIPWAEMSYFKTVDLFADSGNFKEIECFNEENKRVLTIDLRNADTSVEWMEQLLERKLQRKKAAG